jgi:membrane protein YqaA with SNARE-associated domain
VVRLPDRFIVLDAVACTGLENFLTLIERYVVCVVFVSWLRVAIVPLSVVLGALASLCLLSIQTIHSISSPRPCRL